MTHRPQCPTTGCCGAPPAPRVLTVLTPPPHSGRLGIPLSFQKRYFFILTVCTFVIVLHKRVIYPFNVVWPCLGFGDSPTRALPTYLSCQMATILPLVGGRAARILSAPLGANQHGQHRGHVKTPNADTQGPEGGEVASREGPLQRVPWCEQEGLLCKGSRLAEVQGVLSTVPDHSSPLPAVFHEGPQRPGSHRNGATHTHAPRCLASHGDDLWHDHRCVP